MRKQTPNILGGQGEVIDGVAVALGSENLPALTTTYRPDFSQAIVVGQQDVLEAWENAYRDSDTMQRFMAWHEAYERWLARYPSPATQRAYRESWRDFFTFVQRPPWQVLSSDARAWQDSLEARGLKPASINRYLAALSSFYSFVRRDLRRQDDGTERTIFVDAQGRPLENPFRAASLERKKKGPSEVNPLSKAELRAIHDGINTETRTGARDMALYECYLRTGRRLKEIVRLQWKDVAGTREGGGYKMWWVGKGADRNPEKKTGWRVLPASAHAAIVAYLKADGRWPVEDPDMFIFQPLSDHGTVVLPGTHGPMAQNRHISTGHVNGIVKKLARRAGIDDSKVHVHVLRHSFAFHLYDQTKDYELVRNLLDHEDLKTTVGYIGSMQEPVDNYSQALQQALGF
jgi:site-specific recombinase XerD